MKVKKEYLLLGAAIAALISYLVFHRTDRTHYRLPELSKIPAGKISKIQIERAGGSVDAVKKEDKWVLGSENDPADAEAIRSMLDLIESLTVTALVSESKNYSRYQLDPGEKITVRAWTADTLSREFDIGKPAPTYQHTFVKLAGDPNVYHAEGSLRTGFEKSIDELRNRIVLSFVPSEIQEAKITRGEETRVVQRKGGSQTDPAGKGDKTSGWLTSAGEAVNAERVESILSGLSKLECEGFTGDSENAELKNPILSFVLKGKKEYTLDVYPKKESESKSFPAVSSESSYGFMLTKSDVESLEKNFEEMLKTAEVK